MSAHTLVPQLRPDVQCIHQPLPQRKDRRLLRDPVSDIVIEIGEREWFVLEQLDGTRSLDAIAEAFLARFGQRLRPSTARALISQFTRQGFLVDAPGSAEPSRWAGMRPLAGFSDRTFSRMAAALGWIWHPLSAIAGATLLLVALILLAARGDELLRMLLQIPDLVIYAAHQPRISSLGLLRLALLLVILPFLRELVKGIACRRRGLRVPGMRYLWFMRFIPRTAADISAIRRLATPAERVHVVAAALLFEGLVLAAALLTMELAPLSGPIQGWAGTLAFAAALSLLLNALPLTDQDGALMLSLSLQIPDLPARAKALAWARLCLRPATEPLTPARHTGFLLYGLALHAFSVAFNVAVLWLVGYLLVSWLEGAGALAFLLLVFLRFEKQILDGCAACIPSRVRNAMKAKKRIPKPLVAILVIALLIGIGLIPCPDRPSGEFRLQPVLKHELRSKIAARIASIHVSEGQLVTNGQLIAVLMDDQIRDQLAQEQARLLREQAQLTLLEVGAREEQIEQARQKVRLTGTAYLHSSNTAHRVEALHSKEHVSDQDYENAIRQRDVDRETMELAKRELALVVSDARPEDLAAQQAEVERLRLRVAQLTSDLLDTALPSPIDGRITTLYIESLVGGAVQPGDVVALVEDQRRMTVRIALPEAHAGRVRIGATVRIRPWAYPTELFKAEVTEIAPRVIMRSEDRLREDFVEQERGSVRNLSTPEDSVVPVLAELDNAEGRFVTDMTGFAKVDTGVRPIGLILLDPVIRFVQVRVWSWIP